MRLIMVEILSLSWIKYSRLLRRNSSKAAEIRMPKRMKMAISNEKDLLLADIEAQMLEEELLLGLLANKNYLLLKRTCLDCKCQSELSKNPSLQHQDGQL